ncbi:MAG TPA: Ldh family oxidoreductase [Geminicoccaceae bacterium]|nr:Ldh family oxidoreductase [Geminicoccaceae bacterium]
MADEGTGSAYRVDGLVGFTAALFQAAGLAPDRAATVAGLLVEADLMGHTTHGLALAPGYLGELESGGMTAEGEPEVVADSGACVTWDGRRLPGVWLTARAIDLAIERADAHGSGTVAIRRSHHIACLAAFLPRATHRDRMIVIASSDPWVGGRSVAPFGGSRAQFNPGPLACGIPTSGDPILIDMASSITTNGMAARLHKEGRRLPGAWVMDAAGTPSDDPGALFADPPGTILPIGGREYGHKGFGLVLMIEALSQALAGYGRAEAPERWGASVFVQVLDPRAFGGLDAFRRQTDFIADACRGNPPAPGVDRVRLPGERALALRRRALAEGLRLYPGIMDGLRSWADRLGVRPPEEAPAAPAARG